MNKPKITISIPTLNSGPFLPQCLKAIQEQDYKNFEVNIIDGGSTDNTIEIAQSMGVKKCYIYEHALLGARYEGVKKATGEYILLLDSDQILDKDALTRAISILQGGKLDMLIFEEDVYQVSSFLEKLFQLDRRLIHQVKDFSPYTGVMLPRFYKTSLLKKAFSAIPNDLLKTVGGQDHAIIYFEAWKISQKVGLVPHAVYHIEPRSLITLWKKFYRWGGTSLGARYGKYEEMLNKKERFRTGMFKKGLISASIGSLILLVLKGIPFKLGYYRQKYLK